MNAIVQLLETPDIGLYANPSVLDFLTLAAEMRAEERRQFEALGDGEPYDIDDAAIAMANMAGPKWMVLKGERPLAVGGFVPLRPGVYQDWLVGSPEAWSSHWRTITKHCRSVVRRMIATEGVHRIQCIALADRTEAHRWYRVLGYEREGLLRGYGAGGEDAVIYARVNDHGNV